MGDNHEHIGVSVIVLDPKGDKVLLGVRIGGYNAGWYGSPGGRIELKEHIFDCVKRELLEEVGIEATSIEYVGVVRQLQKNTYNFIHFGLVVKSFKGNVKNMEPDKCEKWEWFPLKNLPEKTLVGHKSVIDMYLNPTSPRFRDLL